MLKRRVIMNVYEIKWILLLSKKQIRISTKEFLMSVWNHIFTNWNSNAVWKTQIKQRFFNIFPKQITKSEKYFNFFDSNIIYMMYFLSFCAARQVNLLFLLKNLYWGAED